MATQQKPKMTHRKLRKDRVFRHMARDAPDYKILYVDRDDLEKELEFPGLGP